MINPETLFTKDELERIEQAVVAAEGKTSGEIGCWHGRWDADRIHRARSLGTGARLRVMAGSWRHFGTLHIQRTLR